MKTPRKARVVALGVAVGLAASAGFARPAAAQRAADTVVAAGPEYRQPPPLGWLARLLFGSHHRDAWADTVRLPVLHPDALGGGLRPVRADTGYRTGRLTFADADGRTWTFTDVNPDLTVLVPQAARVQVVTGVLQDLVSAQYPGASLVVEPLAAAAGVAAQPATLGILAADSSIKYFAPRFGGSIGYLRTAGPAADSGITTLELLDRLAADPPASLDTAAYLEGRLFDLYVGTWDLAVDRWRWRQVGPGRWAPGWRLRASAFSRFDGLVNVVGGVVLPSFAPFGDRYRGRLTVTPPERNLDRRLLAALPAEAYTAAARRLQGRLGDAAIAAAVARLPGAWAARDSARFIAALRARRDSLPVAASRLRELVAAEAVVVGTDGPDRAVVTRLPDGGVDVEVAGRFRQRYDARTTKEVLLFLGRGNDDVLVRGAASEGPRVRISAGQGVDRVVDSTGGMGLVVHDTSQVEVRSTGPVAVESGPLEPPAVTLRLDGSSTLEPGTRRRFGPWVTFNSDLGLLLGAGVTRTTYAYGYEPWKARHRLRAGYATRPANGAVELLSQWRRGNDQDLVTLDARYSGIETIKFFGYGNETPRDSANAFYRTNQHVVYLSPGYVWPFDRKSTLDVGLVFKRVDTQLDVPSFISQTGPFGTEEPFSQLGLRAELRHDSRDARTATRRGALVAVGVTAYPGILDARTAFGSVYGTASTYLTPRGQRAFTVAVRGMARYAWGEYPVHEAAYLGGTQNLRGFAAQRFAGDVAVSLNSEARLRVGTLRFVMPWDLGVMALADGGRVWLSGESSDRWHSAFGGGLWAVLPDRSFGGVLWVAKGSDGQFGFWAGTRFNY